MKEKVYVLLAVLVISVFTVGCSSNDKNEQSNLDKVAVRGCVTDININGEQASITVEGDLENDVMYDKAVVEITEDTLIQKDSLSRLFDISDIEKGATVEVVFGGEVKEMYPVQGTASIVRMITTISED